jgi:hypothetical protein
VLAAAAVLMVAERYTFAKASVWGYAHSDVSLVYHEMFEMPSRLQDFLSLRDDDVIFDGGANLGLFSLALSRQADREGKRIRIHAFEPVPQTYAMALRNLADTTNVTVHNVVCGHGGGGVLLLRGGLLLVLLVLVFVCLFVCLFVCSNFPALLVQGLWCAHTAVMRHRVSADV